MSVAQRDTSVPAVKRFRAADWVSLAAAALVILAVGGWWMLRTAPAVPVTRDQRAATAAPPEPAAVTAPAPKVFAFSLSPVSVRSGGDSPTLIIPAGLEVVRLHLEGDAGDTRVDGARARVRTVTGDEVWRGPAEASREAPAGTIAQIDVPAAQLQVDDYVIELFGIDTAGRERERSRYFLRVRAR
jgi:hypothetical protein